MEFDTLIGWLIGISGVFATLLGIYFTTKKPENDDKKKIIDTSPLGNLPRRNFDFTGRDDLLTSLHDALQSNQATSLTQAVAGLGGVGKTELALEYAYRYREDYKIIWWLKAEESGSLLADYTSLAPHLGLEGDGQNEIALRDTVRNKLFQRQDWLLIFDNGEFPKDLDDFLPGGNGHVLITTRRQIWDGAHPFPIEVMKPKEATDFLLRVTGSDDRKTAAALAEDLGYLPLALAHASAYAKESAISLVAYRELFAEKGAELLCKEVENRTYKETIAATWAISVEKLDEEAKALLTFLAFMAPEDIPLDLIKDHSEHLPPPLDEALRDTLHRNDMIRVLRSYSLVSREEGKKGEENISLHRLVQEVTLFGLDKEQTEFWAGFSTNVLSIALPEFPHNTYDKTTAEIYDRLQNHCLTVADRGAKEKLILEKVARVFNQIGFYRAIRADNLEAESLYKKAVAIDEAAFGKDHLNVARDLNNLGSGLIKSTI
ncbi:MAG: FxSxx-COOH system tetratricopeptide repeat protein [Rhodospirillales bacterium]|nr:FxSxx-COOH system tetratricopeptide repeat protein [Rhodospirillales bacterium]